MYKSAVLLLRSAQSSLDFNIALSIGQSSECCEIIPFSCCKDKLLVVINLDQ